MTLSLQRACKVYGSGVNRRTALHECSFECQRGEIVGVVGSNRAGKTTLLRIIASETAVSSGEVQVAGYQAGTRAARRAVGYVGDPPLLPGELSGVEWLKYLCCHRASHPRERTARLHWAIDIAGLGESVGRPIAGYSRGMMQRIALATAAVVGSDLVVLDEAFGGIDPLVARGLRGTVFNLAAMGRIVIIASHDLAALERVAARVLVLRCGRLVSDVPLARLSGERVAELSLSGVGLNRRDRLLERFSGSIRTDEGVAIPLVQGVTFELAMAVCRAERIPVAGSRIRYRALEDILFDRPGESRNGL